MTEAERVTRALPGGRWYSAYGLAFCPAHDNDRTPALSLADGGNGRLLAYCFAGCAFRHVLNALRGLGLVDGVAEVLSADPAAAWRRRAEQAADAAKRSAQGQALW